MNDLTPTDTLQLQAGVDTVGATAMPFGAIAHDVCRIDDAPRVIGEAIGRADKAAWMEGLPPVARPQLPAADTGVAVLIIAIFLGLAVNIRHNTTFLKTFTQDLLSVRRRSNVFDERTVTETRITLSFVLLTCVAEGIVLYFSPVGAAVAAFTPFAGVGLLAALALVYYAFQVVAYTVVGWTFAGNISRRQWVKGFNASQSLLGIFLIVPALTALFHPGFGEEVAVVSAALYILARTVFICKGFRIFYKNPYSLTYFILYLCTLEIVPPVIVYKACTLFGSY